VAPLVDERECAASEIVVDDMLVLVVWDGFACLGLDGELSKIRASGSWTTNCGEERASRRMCSSEPDSVQTIFFGFSRLV
jgi:hypothetical protein